MSDLMRTFQTRVPEEVHAPLAAYATLMGQLERRLFIDIVSGQKATDLKASYLVRYGMTARQFNALRTRVEGKIESVRQCRMQRIEEKQHQLAALEKKLPSLKNKKNIHHKQRRLTRLRLQLKKLQADQESGRVSICFGGRKLFHAQFNLARGFSLKILYTRPLTTIPSNFTV